MIKIKNLTKKAQKKVLLNNVSFEFPDTGLIIIIDKDNIHKAALFSILSLKDTRFSGHIEYLEQKNKCKKCIKKNIHYIEKNNNLIGYLNVEDNLRLFLDKTEYQNSLNFLEKYHLTNYLKIKVKKIAKQVQNLIALTIAFSKKAPIILLDDIIENIDEEHLSLMLSDIVNMSKSSLVVCGSTSGNNEHILSDYIYDISDGNIKPVKVSSSETLDKPQRKNRKVSFSQHYLISKLMYKTTPKLATLSLTILFYSLLICTLFTIFLMKLSKYNYFDYELSNANTDIEGIYLDDTVPTDFDALNEITIIDLTQYRYEDHEHYTNTMYIKNGKYHSLKNRALSFNNEVYFVKYVGIAQQLKILEETQLIADNELIITNYVAEQLNCKESDIVTFNRENFVIKKIINVDYDINLDNEHLYNIIYVSKNYIKTIESFIAKYNFTSNGTKNSNTMCNIYSIAYPEFLPNYSYLGSRTLQEYEFLCGYEFFFKEFEKSSIQLLINEDFDGMLEYMNKCVGNIYKVQITVDNYTYEKEMIFKGACYVMNSIVLNHQTYTQIVDEVELNRYFYYYKPTIVNYQINYDDDSYLDFIKSIESRDDYDFVNKHDFDKNYEHFLNKNSHLTNLLKLEILLFAVLLLISLYPTIKTFMNYKKIKKLGIEITPHCIIKYSGGIIINALIISFLIYKMIVFINDIVI